MRGRLITMVVAVLCLAYFCAFPIALLVYKSFQAGQEFTLANYALVFADAANMKAIAQTLVIALATTGFGLLVAVPFAFLLSRTDLPARDLLRTLLTVPYMIPSFVGAIAWIYLASPRIGYLNRAVDGAWVNIYSMGGLIWVLALFYLPRAFVAIVRAFERLDPAMEEAAYIAGASSPRVVRTITLPLLLPSILAGGFLVFIAAAESFGVPALIGMPANITVVTTKIIQTIYVGTPQALREGTALATILMGFALLLLAGNNLYLARRDYATIGGKAVRPQLIALGRWRTPLFILCLAVSLIFTVLPVLAIVATTFIRSAGLDLLDPSNWTLRNWSGVMTNTKTWRTLFVSFVAASLTATIAVLLGSLIAYMRVRMPGRLSRWPDALAAVGSATPGTVIALAMIVAFSGSYGLNLYGTLWILVAAYLVRSLAVAVRTLAAAFQQLHPVLEEAALASGAGWVRAMKDITFPLLAPSLVGAWFLVFIPSLYELTMSVLLYGTRTQTIGVYLYDMHSYADPQGAAVIATLLLTLVLAGNGLLRWVTRGRVGV